MPDVVLEGLKGFDDAIDAWTARAEKATATAARDAGRAVNVAAAAHVHSVTGQLVASFRIEGPTRLGFGSYEVLAGPTRDYSRRVELTHDGAHAFFKPGFDEAAASFREIFARAWATAGRG